MDVPKEMLTQMFDANKKNAENTNTKPSYDQNGKPRKEEFRTTRFHNDKTSKEENSSRRGEHNGIQPQTGLPKNPFGKDGKPVWDTHSHISGSGRPYERDKPVADSLHVPMGVQSATGGPMYLYVPSERGGRGGEFYTNDGLTLRNLSGELVPH